MRCVIDTNILVSFAIRPNLELARLFDFISQAGSLLVSEPTLTELVDVLNRPKFRRYVSAQSAADYVEWYVGIAELIEVTARVVACRDSGDDKFLELAVSGQADAIISGDTDLLVLHPFRGIRIVDPAGFLAG